MLLIFSLFLLIGCGGDEIAAAIPSGPAPTYTPSTFVIELQQQIDNAGGGWIAANSPVGALSDEDKKARFGCEVDDIQNLKGYTVTASQVPSSFNWYVYLSKRPG